MRYEEFPIPAAWQGYFECLWVLQAPPREHVVYPDGRCELILHLADPPWRWEGGRWTRQAPWLFAAQCRQALRLAAQAPLHCVGLRLRPEASACFWPAEEGGKTLQSWKDQVVDARPWWPRGFTPWSGPAQGAPDAVLAMALDALRQPPASLAQQARMKLDAANGCLTVQALAKALGVSVRALQERFAAAVGLSPKEYGRMRRLQAALQLLDAGGPELAEAALQAGFADQPHATRELQALVGLTPARLRRALAAEREGEQTLALAAAFIRGRALSSALQG